MKEDRCGPGLSLRDKRMAMMLQKYLGILLPLMLAACGPFGGLYGRENRYPSIHPFP